LGVASRHRVKGILFVDYVRMLRAHKGVDWAERLPAEDLPYLHRSIHPGSWYPMDTFERMGNQILQLVARGDLTSTYFDFDALDVMMLHDEEALIAISYHMGMPAEEAASWQTLGFFERLLEVSGAVEVYPRFSARSWAGDPRTLLALGWRMPRRK
jgi:hypothetical protein